MGDIQLTGGEPVAGTIVEPARRRTPYDMLDGAETLKRLVDRFYDIMDSDPRAAGLRAMHAADLAPMKEKLFEFLSGWLGGPALYSRRPDAKCMGEAHAPFAIGVAESEQWMLCMRQALADAGIDAEARRLIEPALARMTEVMRNK